MQKNAFAAGAPPRTPFGELTALPRPLAVGAVLRLVWEGEGRKGEGKETEEKETEGRGGKETGGKGKGWEGKGP